mmetsp:Transcript_50074/g.87423  ORF Transcript_50074/g.87423 Transcript_50074/m.87423 type:complete len:214 (+) Transcript_50074:101-742(+)
MPHFCNTFGAKGSHCEEKMHTFGAHAVAGGGQVKHGVSPLDASTIGGSWLHLEIMRRIGAIRRRKRRLGGSTTGGVRRRCALVTRRWRGCTDRRAVIASKLDATLHAAGTVSAQITIAAERGPTKAHSTFVIITFEAISRAATRDGAATQELLRGEGLGTAGVAVLAVQRHFARQTEDLGRCVAEAVGRSKFEIGRNTIVTVLGIVSASGSEK